MLDRPIQIRDETVQQKALILEVMQLARDHYSRKDLAEILGITGNQVTDICAGRAALPFVAALKLAELLNVEPLPLLCANEYLLEKNPEKRSYLEPFFANSETAHNLYLCALTESLKSVSSVTENSVTVNKKNRKVLQGAEYFPELQNKVPRNVPGYRFDWAAKKSTWALRPIPSFPKFYEPEEAPRSPEGWKTSNQKKQKAGM